VGPYSVLLKASVEKDLRRLPAKACLACLAHISELRDDPRPRRTLQLTSAERTYRLRVGSYRVVYQVDDVARVVTIQYVRHRKDAYRR
jgi:mRNA interferase RelE/StbE